MPQRSRTHELEDESIDKFKARIPKRWVCREKDRDYGIDLEVEIFDEDRNATGLLFYVQLKATDDKSKERKVAIQVDRLRYLASFDIPSIVARYCSYTENIFWIWNFRALDQANLNSKTVNIIFSDEWSESTVVEIENVLRKFRRLKNIDRNEKFPISLDYEVPFHQRIVVETALVPILSSISFLKTTTSKTTELELTISFSGREIKISLDPIGFLVIPIQKYQIPEVSGLLMLGLTAVMMRMGFDGRAAVIAKLCLSADDLSHAPKELSLVAATALSSSPAEAVELAIKAGLHKQQDGFYGTFVAQITTAGGNKRSSLQAMERFYEVSASFQEGECRGTTLYSLANNAVNLDKYAKAVAAFNSAKKFRPQYNSSAYFFRELGGALFLGRKFRCAASAYSSSLELEYEDATAFCYADSLLFANAFNASAEVMQTLCTSDSSPFASEARLKTMLANWLASSVGIRSAVDVAALSKFARDMHDNNDNLSCYRALLMAAFAERNAADLWSYAIQFSIFSHSKAETLDVMICADLRCGIEAYSLLRDRVSSIGFSDDELIEIDDIAAEARAYNASMRPKPFKVRLIDGDKIIVLSEPG